MQKSISDDSQALEVGDKCGGRIKHVNKAEKIKIFTGHRRLEKGGKIVSRQDQTHLHQQAVKEKCKLNNNFSGLKDMQLFFTEAVLMLKPLLIVALLHEISTCCQQISLKTLNPSSANNCT